MNNINTPFPKIMGILNTTPDSFSDGGKFYDFNDAVRHAIEMIDDGADIIDIGGESTRPGAESISTDEEIQRTIPVIKAIKEQRPDIEISIDTTKAEVAKSAMEAGASIINCVNGMGRDINLIQTAAKYNAELILMHMQGSPRTMQIKPVYDDVVGEVFSSLKNSIGFAKTHGAKKIIADVGIGFGKTLEHNLALLRNIRKFLELDVPLCLGLSRKSFIGQLLGIETATERDQSTVLLHSLLLNSGISIIRIHNIKLINQLKLMYKKIY